MPTAIPALQPIVHDLFVLRGTNKADAGKELETQKEVVVSMLLRLIQYHQVRGGAGSRWGRKHPCGPGCSSASVALCQPWALGQWGDAAGRRLNGVSL